MRTIFLTGAEGFTGRHLAAHLKRLGFDVVGGVRNRARKLAFEREFGRGIVCDVSDSINVARAIAGVRPDAVVHLAGTTQAYPASDDPLAAYQSIVTGWANLLDAVRRTVPRARVVLVSSGEVYGRADRARGTLDEAAPVAPCTTIGSLKATAESVARTFFQNFHLDLVIARPFHYFGAGQSENFFFSAVAKRVVAGAAEIELPDLSFERDLLHVQDAVAGLTALLSAGQPNEIYNIAGGRTQTVRQVCDWIARAANRQVNFVELPANTNDQIPWLCGNSTRLTAATGWQPTQTVETAAGELVRWWESQKSPAPATT